MRTSSRYGLALGLSFALHLATVFSGLWTVDVGLDVTPEFEFEFQTVELVDPDLLQTDQAALEPPPLVGPPPPDTPPEEGPGEPEPEPEEPEPEQEKQFGDKRSKIKGLGPTNSTFYMLLANAKVAKLPFAEEVVEIIAPLPDFGYIVQGGGFHALRDFQYIVLASPDIRDLTQTFLAVQHKVSQAEVKAGIERAAAGRDETLEWEQRGELWLASPRPRDETVEDRDPRWFVLLPDDIALYVREEFLPQILEGPDKNKGKTAGNFVANIARMRRFTRQEPRAGLQLVLSDMRAALKSAKLPYGLDFPDDLEIMAEASRTPELVVKLGYVESPQAQKAADFWQEDLRQIIDGDLRIKFVAGSIYSSTSVERDGRTLTLRNAFDEAQAKMILGLLGDMSRKMMRRSADEMAKAKAEREEMWKRRKNGKLSPSEALGTESGDDAASAEAGSRPTGTAAAAPDGAPLEAPVVESADSSVPTPGG